jgi:hypothetical protein
MILQQDSFYHHFVQILFNILISVYLWICHLKISTWQMWVPLLLHRVFGVRSSGVLSSDLEAHKLAEDSEGLGALAPTLSTSNVAIVLWTGGGGGGWGVEPRQSNPIGAERRRVVARGWRRGDESNC